MGVKGILKAHPCPICAGLAEDDLAELLRCIRLCAEECRQCERTCEDLLAALGNA
jgi:hypothetical protein